MVLEFKWDNMKYLKFFESYKNIDAICEAYDIYDYTINNDGTVDVDGDVIISRKGLDKFPLRFRNIMGNFEFDNNNLTSLDGAPLYVSGDFYCIHNKLESLKGAPEIVGNGFYCGDNLLTTLEGSPKIVGGLFNCHNNKLTTLEGITKSIGGSLSCGYNELISLNGCPSSITKLYCNHNPIYKWWSQINDVKYLEIFQDMNIHPDDPDDINQEKIDIILNN